MVQYIQYAQRFYFFGIPQQCANYRVDHEDMIKGETKAKQLAICLHFIELHENLLLRK
jgi:hypothetical protein